MALPGAEDDLAAIFEPSNLPAASSFMSSRWSRDNLITCHPAHLYDGSVKAHIDQDVLGHLIQELERTTGPLSLQSVLMGVCTWEIACESREGPVVVQLPLALDEPGQRSRAKRAVPHLNASNMQYYIDRGLTRFVNKPLRCLTLGAGVQAAVFTGLPGYPPLTFSQGSLQVDLSSSEESWSISLGPRRTADLLAEMVAAIAYHYEPELAGGTTIADVFVNDGDFVTQRRPDGSFDVKLTQVRTRESGISPSLLLLYLTQLNTFEDWEMDAGLSGLPTLISNPSIAFEGLTRGLRYRYRDQGLSEAAGVRLGRQWIEGFGKSRLGHAYRPWVDRFLEGQLEPTFGDDLREHWWRLLPLRQKHEVRALLARQTGDVAASSAARDMQTLLERLSGEIGATAPHAPEQLRVNDLDRHGLVSLLENAGCPLEARDSVAGRLLAHWPYRSIEHLLAKVPEAHHLQKLPIVFGRVVAAEDEGTLNSLPPPNSEIRGARPLANAEVLCGMRVPAALVTKALELLPTFEAFMDMALHDEKWGYYATSVVIGKGGHFDTHPETFSPHYGEWVARAAFASWQEMRRFGDLSDAERFSVVEFGAGNGRLARDFLDAVAKKASDSSDVDQEHWQAFAFQLEYRIYELSASLREKQRALLGGDAIVSAGDARRPLTALGQDFPQGVRGLILTNEVPDAFGVHKVLLARDGQAMAALVLPRVESGLLKAIRNELVRQVKDSDARLRQLFGLERHPADAYLDGESYALTMRAIATFSARKREALLCKLWFEEVYVPASSVPGLGEHLRMNAAEYATALAAENSGVVVYVNVHACRFIEQLARSLAAGSIITIDYGDTTWGLLQGARRGDFPFRVYRDEQDYVPRPNDPYTAPGTQDMTADVNFTELAMAGQRSGLTLVHYGHERDLAGSDLPELLRASGVDGIAAFLGAGVFKVLVLGTRASDVFKGPLATPLPLFSAIEADATELG